MLAWWTLRRLRSNDYLVRERAKEKLVRARAIKPLVAALSDERSSEIALKALVEIGDPARQELAGALVGSRQRVRSLSAVALGRLGDERSVPVLLITMDDPEADAFSKAESIRLLGKLKVDDARDRIRALLNEPGLGDAAASALADLGAFEDLLVAAEARNRSAIRALGLLGDPRAVDPLVQMLNDPNGNRTDLVEALGELRDARATEPLLKVFQDLHSKIKEATPNHYGFMPDWVPSSRRELAAVLSSLGKIGDERAHEPIGNLMRAERLFVQHAIAAENNGSLHSSSDVLKSGVRALAEFGDPDDASTMHLLIALMERASSAVMGWQVGGWERSREFREVRDAAERSLRTLERRMLAKQAESKVSAAETASQAAVSNASGHKNDGTIRDKIMGWIGPTAVFATPPIEEFIALGEDAIPVVVDIFSRPQEIPDVREFGSGVYLPILVALLDHYARQGSEAAGHALFEIANSRIPTWGPYAAEARALAHQLAQKILEAPDQPAASSSVSASAVIEQTPTASDSLAVGIVVFRPGPAPTDADRYCRQVLERKFDGRTLDQWRIIGVKQPIAPSDASALHRQMVVEGKLPYFGRECGKLECSGPDGVDIVALFFAQQEIGEAAGEAGIGEIVSSGDLDKIAAYWRGMGQKWWREQEESRESAICDQCNSTIARGQGFLHGSYLLCERCCDKRLATDALERLREDPNYFGAGLVEQARASANSAEAI